MPVIFVNLETKKYGHPEKPVRHGPTVNEGVMPVSDFGANIYTQYRKTLYLKDDGKKRAKWLNPIVTKTLYPVNHFKKIEEHIIDGRETRSYVVTLSKGQVSAEQRVRFLMAALYEEASDKERVICESGAVRIIGQGYQINYYIEGYRANADKRFIFCDGEGKGELLHRSGCLRAYNDLKYRYDAGPEILAKVFHDMNKEYYTREYPDAAERYVKLCNREKQEIQSKNRWRAHVNEERRLILSRNDWQGKIFLLWDGTIVRIPQENDLEQVLFEYSLGEWNESDARYLIAYDWVKEGKDISEYRLPGDDAAVARILKDYLMEYYGKSEERYIEASWKEDSTLIGMQRAAGWKAFL